MRTIFLSILASALLPLSACNLYFSGGDPEPCEFGGGTGTDSLGEPQEVLDLRNPDSGQCETFFQGGGGGGGWPCDDRCGPCPVDSGGDSGAGTGGGNPTNPDAPQEDRTEQAPELIPTWGACQGSCSDLSEDICSATSGCRSIYTELGFQACWHADTEYQTNANIVCSSLDAEQCSRNDACAALHASSCDIPDSGSEESDAPLFTCSIDAFISCQPESNAPQGCYGDEECGNGFSCNASEICLSPPGGGQGDECPEELCGVPAVCYGFCVPDYNPGECEADVVCESVPPQCPADTTPGIADGCWTGYCIPLSECPQMDCSDIASETHCVAREECSPYYQGVNCECNPEGCECSEWVFDSCS